MIWYICQLQLGWHPVAVVQYTFTHKQYIGKGKAVLLQAWSDPEGSRNVRFPDYMTTAQDGGKVVSLTHRPPLPPGNIPGTLFCYRPGRPQGHSAAGRIMSMKNSNFTIGNQTRDLPTCSTVQPTAPPHAPFKLVLHDYVCCKAYLCSFAYVDASVHCDFIYVRLCLLLLMLQFPFFCHFHLSLQVVC
jgi:hypothetical protein